MTTTPRKRNLRHLWMLCALLLLLFALASCASTQQQKDAQAFNDAIELLTDTLLEDDSSARELLSELDVSVENIGAVTVLEQLPSFFVIQGNTLYPGRYEDGKEIFTGLARLYDDGYLLLSQYDDGVSADAISPLTHPEEAGLFSVSEYTRVLYALLLSEEEMDATDKERVYTLNEDYRERLGGALGTELPDEMTVRLSMREYDEEGKIYLDLEDGKGGKLLRFALTVKKDGLFKKQIELSCDLGDAEIELLMTTKWGSPSELQLRLEVDGVDIEGKLSYESLRVRDWRLVAEARLDASLKVDGISYDANALISQQSSFFFRPRLLTLEGEVLQGKERLLEIDGSLDYSALKEEDASPVRLTALADADGEELSFELEMTTAKYSKKSSEYALSCKIDSRDVKNTIFATAYLPSRIAPEISEEAKYYLQISDNLFENYTTHYAKAAELTKEVQNIIVDGGASLLKDGYYTYDEETGFYYMTDILVSGGAYSIVTYPVVQHEGYLLSYYENLGGFLKYAPPGLRKETERLIDDVMASVPEGYTHSGFSSFSTYRYLEEIDAYLVIDSVRSESATVTKTRPTGKTYHEYRLAEDGTPLLHTFEESLTADCKKQLVCTDCGFSMLSKDGYHATSFVHKELVGGVEAWTLTVCEACGEGELLLYNTGNCPVKVWLKGYDPSIVSSTVTANAVLENYAVHDPDHALVVSRIDYLRDPSHTAEEVTIVIPDLRPICAYTIVGVTGTLLGEADLHSTLRLPEGVEFLAAQSLNKAPFSALHLPSTLLFIGNLAMNKMDSLGVLTIPENTVVWDSVTVSMSALTSLSVEGDLVRLPYLKCPALSALSLKGSVETVDGFAPCKVTELILPEGTKHITKGFGENQHLERVVLSSTVQTLGESAFYTCPNLTEVVLSPSLVSIGDNAFAFCSALEKLWTDDGTGKTPTAFFYEMPEGLTSLGAGAFTDTPVVSLVLSDGVTVIEQSLCDMCDRLERVILGNGVTSIEYSAFSGCGKLAQMENVGALKHIGAFAFSGCSLLSDAIFNQMTSLETVDGYAFSRCTSLKNIVFHPSVVSVQNAFMDCELKSVHIYSVNVASGAYAEEIHYYTPMDFERIPFSTGVKVFLHHKDFTCSGVGMDGIIRSKCTVYYVGTEEEFRANGFDWWEENVTVYFEVEMEEPKNATPQSHAFP